MKEVTDIKPLYGIFQHYNDGKTLTDKYIEDAIGETMFERNFKCCQSITMARLEFIGLCISGCKR